MALRILTTARDIATLAAVTGAGLWLLGVGLVLANQHWANPFGDALSSNGPSQQVVSSVPASIAFAGEE